MMNDGYTLTPSGAGGSGGDTLLVDLLNTTPTVAGERTDALSDRARARDWLAAHGAPDPAAGDLDHLRRVRDALQHAVDGPEPELGPLLEGVALEPAGGADGLTWALRTPPGRELAVAATLAWEALRATAPDRLRACANDECTLFLIDRSRNNSARWCSMASCGNRMKARRHHRRHADDAGRAGA